MKKVSIPSALKELSSRNSAVLAAYRDWARRLPPGSASRLASSMAEQRLELGKVLQEVGAAFSSHAEASRTDVEFEVDPSFIQGTASGAAEPKALLKAMADIESAEHELLAAASGAALPLSLVLAEKLAGEAASARLRANWAQDQLELLSMA